MVIKEEKEIVERLETWVLRVNEVPKVQLENQAPQDLRVDKVTEEIWEIPECRELRDRLETQDPLVHLAELEILDFLEHEARMVHRDCGVNVDPEESKAQLAHRVLRAVKARMAYLELTDYRVTEERPELLEHRALKGHRVCLVYLVNLDRLVPRGILVLKVDKELREKLVKMASRAMMVLLGLLVSQAYQDLREKTAHPDEQESVEIEEQLEVEESLDPPGDLVFLELWAHLVRKVPLECLETQAKRVPKESKVALDQKERPGIWEL